MKQIDKLPPRQIEEVQFQRFKKILEQACAHSPYYSSTFKALGISPSDIASWNDLPKLPVLSTQTLLERNLEFPAGPAARMRRVIVSGGTMGSPKICFYADNMREIIRAWAEVWQGSELAPEDMVTILAPIPLASGMVIMEMMEEIGTTTLPVGITTAPEFTARLMKQLKATAIISQPSTLQHFAEQIKAFGYSPRDFNLRKAFLGSEVLTGGARRQIEEQWGCEVFDTSGSSEVGLIGAECTEHNGQHLSVGTAYFEVLDLEKGAPVTDGMGQLFITTLLNIGLPLFRYDMKDVVRITSEPCKCGRTTPRIWFMGRADDRLVLKTGVKFYSYQVDEALAPFNQLTGSYNVIATGDERQDAIKLVIETQEAALADSALRKRVADAIISSSVDFKEIHLAGLVRDPEVEFVPVGALERTGRGKIKNRFRDHRKD